MAHRARRRHAQGHAHRGPRYTGLELCSAALNVMGGLALIAGGLVALAGIARIMENRPAEGMAMFVSGVGLMSAGVIEVGVASGLAALRDIARNTYSTAAALR